MAERIIPVVEEKVEIGKRRHTATVTVKKSAHQEVRPVEATLDSEYLDVERVPVDRMVDGPVPDRWEGDTLIVSVLEEVLVVEKRLRVAEEVRISRRHETEEVHDTVQVNVETAEVERREGR